LADEVLFVPDKNFDLYTRKGALYAVVGEIVASIGLVDRASHNRTLSERILRYISEHYTDNLSLGKMARDLGYDERYLSRCFHRIIPLHFSRYVNQLRVETAIELLQRSDRSLSEIALECGFGSIRSFDRVFAEVTGKAPREFR
jgi:transcriptional regulator GlxA family with amidase domain